MANWWKMSSDIWHERVACRCDVAKYNGDNTGAHRERVLMRLLCASANDRSYTDAGDMAMRLGLQRSHCTRVWDICIEENVLRPTADGGYNALAWMIERGYFGDGRTEAQRQNARRQAPAQGRVVESRCSSFMADALGPKPQY